MRRADSGRARLVYVLGAFPSLSETFILREMVALEQMGFHVTPVCLVPTPDGQPVHAEAEPFVARALHRPRPFSAASLGALLRACLQRPLGVASASWFLVRELILRPGWARELVSAYLAAAYFASRLRRRDLRHVHAHWAGATASVGIMLAEMCGCAFSLSCHVEIFRPEIRLLSRKLREADFVTVCTQYGLERLQRSHSLIAAEKLHLIHHGVDAARLAAETHVDYPLPLILSVGRLVEKKGFPFLLQAAAILSGQGMQFELIIVGDGPLRDELERLVGGLGLRDKVIFAGALTQEELGHVFRRADALALASIIGQDGDRDGLPNVILEAMAYGVPVVASNITAIPEAVIPEETGLLAAPGSPQELAAQLERALGDDELRQRLIVNAQRKVAAEFDQQKNVVVLARLFADSLGLSDWPGPDTAWDTADTDAP
jgi:glycosyltransferase involved in cell wall biosynthesis